MKRDGPLFGLLCVLGACAVVFFARLGDGGLAYTEAFRATPAVEMLERSESGVSFQRRWLVPTLFDRDYLRKPPGMPLGIAASYAVFGESVWAARVVSALAATLTALLAFWFGRRWFGPVGGVASGLAAALTPLIWDGARHAEIEALNHLGVALATYPLVHGVLWARGVRTRVVCGALAGVGVLLMLIAKGPAGLAVPVAAWVGAAVATRSVRALVGLAPQVTLGITGLALFGAWLAMRGVTLADDAVIQSPGDFLWQDGKVGDILLLVPVGLVQLLPASLALLFPWGPDAKREVEFSEGAAVGWRTARALSLSVLLTLIGMSIAGIGNPRYAWPVSVALWPIVGYAVAGVLARQSDERAMLPKRRSIGRAMLLGRGWVWPVALLAAFPVYVAVYEAPRRATSGTGAGLELGAAFPETARGKIVYANDAVEGRPEALRAFELATESPVRWVAGDELIERVAAGGYAIVRMDNGELDRMRERVRVLTAIAEVRAAQYRYALVRGGSVDG
ncbi:MAG: glycosyltransferase family 39 protein [Planctomycetota bacterium]